VNVGMGGVGGVTIVGVERERCRERACISQ
jgi:hypothetical protein